MTSTIESLRVKTLKPEEVSEIINSTAIECKGMKKGMYLQFEALGRDPRYLIPLSLRGDKVLLNLKNVKGDDVFVKVNAEALRIRLGLNLSKFEESKKDIKKVSDLVADRIEKLVREESYKQTESLEKPIPGKYSKPVDENYKRLITHLKTNYSEQVDASEFRSLEDFKRKPGSLPFHFAVHFQDWELVWLLVQAGLDINQKDKDGNTAALLACVIHDSMLKLNFDTIKQAVEARQKSRKVLQGFFYKADLTIRNKEGISAIELIVKEDLIDNNELFYLLKNIVSTNGVSESVKSLERVIVHSNAINIIQFLIQLGVDIDTPDENGNTALTRAVKRKDRAFIRNLLELGANPDLAIERAKNKIKKLKSKVQHLMTPVSRMENESDIQEINPKEVDEKEKGVKIIEQPIRKEFTSEAVQEKFHKLSERSSLEDALERAENKKIRALTPKFIEKCKNDIIALEKIIDLLSEKATSELVDSLPDEQ